MNEVDAALISNPFYYSRAQLQKIRGIIEPVTRVKHAKLIGRIGSLLGLYVGKPHTRHQHSLTLIGTTLLFHL